MKLNGSKTQILVVNPTATSLPVNVLCCGSPIEVVEEAKYLGLHVHCKNGLGASIAKLEQRFWMAWADLIKGYSNLQCGISLSLMIDLYLTCLPPLISYGAEVWAFRTFKGLPTGSSRPRGSKLLDAHKKVLSQILGVRSSIRDDILNREREREININPLWSTWLLRMVRFWNSIVDMGPTRLHYKMLVQDLNLAITMGRETFAGTVLGLVQKIGYHTADHVHLDKLDRLDVRRLQDLLDRQADLLWEGLHPGPRACPSSRALYCRYYRWVIRPQHVPKHKAAHKLSLPLKVLKTFLRFRLIVMICQLILADDKVSPSMKGVALNAH
jgi:hypothetical protein